jgi:outer membrane lipoprotein SlyB
MTDSVQSVATAEEAFREGLLPSGPQDCPFSARGEVHLNRHLAAVVIVQLAACTTTRTTSTTWISPPAERLGSVAWVRQTTRDERGNPVGGAVLGGLVGGLFGTALAGGRTPGTVIGAVGGAAAGAALSQGSSETFFDVGVRFDDGGQQVFRFPYQPNLVTGERVGVIGDSLRSLGQVFPSPPPGPPPQFVPPPPPPPAGGMWPPPPPP